MNEDKRIYGANNIAHCFSRHMMFHDWFNVLNEEQQNSFKINDYSVHDFMLGSTKPGKVKTRKYKHMPLPIHFVIKHKNQGKIESHKWFFKGFCEYMEPTYAQIIDCGSIPLWKSISHIIWHMETIPDVGGACGEIEVMLPNKKDDGTAISFIESILLRGQYVEYKLSHYMDKAAESLFGFVSVLPGAFSTFRWECIKGKPLNIFLQASKDLHNNSSISCCTANRYLAEYRVMCLEIIAKENEEYVLHYIPGTKCLTDTPTSLIGLLKQRRKWYNGSLCASIYVLFNMCRVWRRKKCSYFRNIFYMILYLYMMLQMMLSLVVVGIFYGSFNYFLNAILPQDQCLNITRASNIIDSIYLMFLLIIVIICTSIRVEWCETGFIILSVFMILFTLIIAILCIIYFIQQTLASISVIFIIVFILSNISPLIINYSQLKICDVIRGLIYNFYLIPSYINIFTIYSISNIHDVSWSSRLSVNFYGTKALEPIPATYLSFRANFLASWLLLNIFFGYGIVYIFQNKYYFILFTLEAFFITMILLKLLCSTIYYFKSKYDRRKVSNLKKTKSSRIFETEEMYNIIQDDFQVYQEVLINNYIIKNSKDSESNSVYPTSVENNNICMGFDIPKELEKYRKAQDEIIKLSRQKFNRHNSNVVSNIDRDIHEFSEESKVIDFYSYEDNNILHETKCLIKNKNYNKLDNEQKNQLIYEEANKLRLNSSNNIKICSPSSISFSDNSKTNKHCKYVNIKEVRHEIYMLKISFSKVKESSLSSSII